MKSITSKDVLSFIDDINQLESALARMVDEEQNASTYVRGEHPNEPWGDKLIAICDARVRLARNEYRTKEMEVTGRLAAVALAAGDRGEELVQLMGESPRSEEGFRKARAILKVTAERLTTAAAQRRDEKGEKEPAVLAALIAHPDWTDEQIAAEAGCSRTSLYRMDNFKEARAAQRSGRNRFANRDQPKADDDA